MTAPYRTRKLAEASTGNRLGIAFGFVSGIGMHVRPTRKRTMPVAFFPRLEQRIRSASAQDS